MEKAAAGAFRRRWQALAALEQAGQPASPETRLRQLEGLLEIARSAGWPLDKLEAELNEVRRRWRRLRARPHERPAR